MKRMALVVCLCLACGSAFAGTWDDLWMRRDQQAQRLLDSGRAADAAERFTDPRRRAYAEIKAGQFAQAAKHLEPFKDVDSLYNRGNALARAGDLRGALAAYDAALAKDPDNRDARHNRDLVARALQRHKNEKPASSGRSGGQHGAGHSAGDDSSPGPAARNVQQGSSGKSSSSGSSSGAQGRTPDSGASSSQSDMAQAQRGAGAQSGVESERRGDADEGTRGTGQENAAVAGATPAQTAPGSGANANGAAQSGGADTRREAEIAADLMRKQTGRGTNAAGPDEAGKNSAAANQYALGIAEDGGRGALRPPKPVSEETLALDQWLRRIPDDPGELLQRKFLIEHLMKQRSAKP